MSDLILRAGFLTPLEARKIGSRTWRLLAPLRYASIVLGRVVEVPAAFETDFDSIPRWLPVTYAVLANRVQEEATIHDYLYRVGAGVSREEADAVLYEAMKTKGEPWAVRWPIWAGVRLGGWASFHRIALGLAVVLALLLTGCATGVMAVTPHTSPEIEAARAMCLEEPGGMWMERADVARCAVPVPMPVEPEKKS